MSYPEPSARSTFAPTARPGSLVAAMGAAVVSGIAAIATGVVILAGGLDLIKELGNDLLAAELGVSAAEVEARVETLGVPLDDLYAEAQQTFQTRAYLVLVFGVAMVLLGLLMRRAATWARVLVTVAAALTVVFAAVVAVDEATTMMLALAWVAVLGSVVTMVLTWLPGNRRYAKAIA